ncbi:Argonaute complex, subunit Arb1 [Penicillium italicum]|uniref:Argonaute complex, subunit Arb1 n=1 Tax=Penicillium italicum TaxID=40296 RepID=A0A0A2LEG3_PENIT|nr:Argonaute complex, subunit Arb1 [Penicillium italicum]
MDDSPKPACEDNLSTAAQSLSSSVSEEPTKLTAAMTGDGATANLGPTIQDQEHGEVTKEGSFASSPESGSKSRRSSAQYARVQCIDPAVLAKSEPKEVASKTEQNVQDALVNSDQESNKHVIQAPAKTDLGGGLPKPIDFAVGTKERANTADTTHPKESAVSENAPKVGFKHDPNEEKFLANVELDVGTSRKKKKNKRRPKSQRGENAPSGFEPFYADAPMTPMEFEENKTIYDPALPILDRIDEGIKRFLYKRRLEPYRRKVFLKYLQYGGVSVGPNHSQGVTPSELKEMTKEEAMQARCNTAIFPKMGKPYPISFNDVATGYLTGFYMGHYNPDTEEEIKVCTDTMKNFFSYLLYHNVCPEQTEDLEEARKTCDRAAKELWMNQQLVQHQGPGDFNRGCSLLFGGYYFEDVVDPEAWTNVRYADQKVFTTEMARKVVKYGVAIAGNDRTARKFKVLVEMGMTEATQVPDIDGFEIISVEAPTEETIAYYRELCPDLAPVGKIHAKEFRDPARGPFDLAPWEKIDWDAGFAPAYEFEFLVETRMFAHILPGMKIISDVYQTNFGQYYFDEILAVLPTFYKFMYNDWMMDYEEPMSINFIPDEEEVARRRAKDSILCPPEPTPAEWAMHMLTHELDFNPKPGDDAMVAVWQIIHTLEVFGWDLEEVKDLMGLVDPNPRKGKEKSTEGEQSHTRLSNEPRNHPFYVTPKENLDRTLNNFQNPEKIKPVIAPEIIAKFLKEKKEQLEKEQAKQGAQSAKPKIAKGKELEGKPIQGPTVIQGTQSTLKEQGIAKNQKPEGQPIRGPTETSKEQAVEKNEEIKDEMKGVSQ